MATTTTGVNQCHLHACQRTLAQREATCVLVTFSVALTSSHRSEDNQTGICARLLSTFQRASLALRALAS